LFIWQKHVPVAVGTWCRGDFNADALVNEADFFIWLENRFQSSFVQNTDEYFADDREPRRSSFAIVPSDLDLLRTQPVAPELKRWSRSELAGPEADSRKNPREQEQQLRLRDFDRDGDNQFIER
jgi:hypothetical protein